MGEVHSTDRYTQVIEQSANHKNTLMEQLFHCCFVAEFRPPAPKTDFYVLASTSCCCYTIPVYSQATHKQVPKPTVFV